MSTIKAMERSARLGMAPPVVEGIVSLNVATRRLWGQGPHRAERRREPSGGKPLDSLNAARRLAEGAGHSVELLIVTEVLCIKTCNFG